MSGMNEDFMDLSFRQIVLKMFSDIAFAIPVLAEVNIKTTHFL